MTLDGVLDAYRRKLLTVSELFASLTALLSEHPEDLAATRAALAFDHAASAAFEEWLDDLRFQPVILLGNRHVHVSRELAQRLGPPNMPAPRLDPTSRLPIGTVARIRVTAAAGSVPATIFGARVRPPGSPDDLPYGRYSVVVWPIGDVDLGGEREILASIAPAGPDVPGDALQGSVELFRGTTRIGVMTVTPSFAVEDRSHNAADFDFLAREAAA